MSDKDIKILACGDIMLGSCALAYAPFKYQLPYAVENNRIDFSQDIRLLFDKSDIRISNLECTISRNKFSYKNKTFIAPYSALNVLKQLDINIVSLANNHTNDCGQEYVYETKQILKDSNISYLYSPETSDAIVLKSLYGKKIGFIGYGLKPHFTFEICNQYDPDNYIDLNYYKDKIERLEPNSLVEPLGWGNIIPLLKMVEELRSEVDYIVLYIHWGYAQTYIPSFFQIKIAHKLIDMGVDIIIGTHPHVIQPIEEYKNKIIVYSLGNFLFDMWQKKNRLGMLIQLTLNNGISFNTHYCYMSMAYKNKLIQKTLKQIKVPVDNEICYFYFPKEHLSCLDNIEKIVNSPYMYFHYRDKINKNRGKLFQYFLSDLPISVKLTLIRKKMEGYVKKRNDL